MKLATAKRWFYWHKWTSLVCTLFLLMLCATGLPLIFHEEIDSFFNKSEVAVVPPNASQLSLDSLTQIAESVYPGLKARYIYWNKDQPNAVAINVAPKPNADFGNSHYVILNEFTGKQVGQIRTDGLMYDILQIHTDLFAGAFGRVLLCLMAVLFIVAIISGIVLYGPIMKKFDFGMVRKNKSKRLKILDTHNLLGIVLAAWMLVVGGTGVINTLSPLILSIWKSNQMKEMTAPYANQPPAKRPYASLDSAVALAEAKVPDMKPLILTYPGTLFSSQHHYAIFMTGNTALKSRLLQPVLIDAKTGLFTDSRAMPWYVNALFLSEPLHFGDYGGITLKIIWAVLDVLTIIILITGLRLWLIRRKSQKQQWKRLEEKQKQVEHEKDFA